METLKTLAYQMPTKQVTQLGKNLKANGYDVKRDDAAGTMVASIDGKVYVRALQTGRGRGWIVRADPAAITVQ
jgi:hypothetical protein